MSYDRLIHPLVRENGVPRRATWDEALEQPSPHDNPCVKGQFGYGYV
ncbi:hypothetical protein ACFOY2_00960 [Nonomuraea purpurea]|uniref:Uncharacterized protein n=1 Tax=Nonomuraea purpurea TaxID=1849276 RepID=A0ABV8G038_9ACTN